MGHFAYDSNPMRDLTALAQALIPLVEQAGAAILQIYEGEFAVAHKDDASPLTLADLESQHIIAAGLAKLTPDIPILSEESAQAPWSERRAWNELWVVDPLDGTREFVKRNGEFTINIALVVAHEPVLGIVAAPYLKKMYWGAVGVGAYRQTSTGQTSPAANASELKTYESIKVSAVQDPLRVVGSRSHASAETAAYLQTLKKHVLQGVGSSLKFCLIAEGEADLYPRFGPTSEWDTAAGQAILEAAGGQVTRVDGHRLRYNCRTSLINGDFLAFNEPPALNEPL